jgi:hypothetical protein
MLLTISWLQARNKAPRTLAVGRKTWLVLLAWNSALVLWAAALASIRRRQNPRRQWPWLWPTAFLLVSDLRDQSQGGSTMNVLGVSSSATA